MDLAGRNMTLTGRQRSFNEVRVSSIASLTGGAKCQVIHLHLLCVINERQLEFNFLLSAVSNIPIPTVQGFIFVDAIDDLSTAP